MIFGNVTTTICNHLPQFLFAPNVPLKASCQKSNVYERDWSRFIETDFALAYFGKSWSDVLQVDQQDVDLFVESFSDSMNSILNKYAPIKWINKYKLKFKSKPCIIPAI